MLRTAYCIQQGRCKTELTVESDRKEEPQQGDIVRYGIDIKSIMQYTLVRIDHNSCVAGIKSAYITQNDIEFRESGMRKWIILLHTTLYEVIK